MKQVTIIKITAIIIALASAYYILVLLPAQRQAEELIKSELACSEMQDKITKHDMAYFSQLKYLVGYEMPSAENHFNRKLQKCFVKLSKYTNISVYDAIENRVLIDCMGKVMETNGNATCYSENVAGTPDVITQAEFDQRERVYMSE